MCNAIVTVTWSVRADVHVLIVGCRYNKKGIVNVCFSAQLISIIQTIIHVNFIVKCK